MQGQSPAYTPYKEGVIGACYGYWFKRLPAPKRFVQVDTNCGCGRNRKTIGTPLLVRRAAIKHRVQLVCHLIDKSRAAISELQRQPEFGQGNLFDDCDRVEAFFHRKDNAVALREVGSSISKEEKGALLCDPNGCSGKSLPLDSVREFLRAHPNFNLIVHVSGIERTAGYARVNPAIREAYDKNGTIYSLRQLTDAMPLPVELVHRFANGTGVPHLLLVYSSRFMPPMERAGLFRFDSIEGREVLRKYESA